MRQISLLRSPESQGGGTAAQVRLLHLEDSATDAELVRDILEQDGLSCMITQVPDRGSFEAMLAGEIFDLILCDHGLPGYDGFAALALAQRRQPDTPVIMLSGSLDDAQAVESLKNGATDYILKQKLARLAPAVRRALRDAEERKIRNAAEQRIQYQAELLNLTSEAIVVRSLDDRIVFWNKGAETMFGWGESEALGKEFADLLGGDLIVLEGAKEELLRSGGWVGEFRLRSRVGDEVIVFSRWTLLKGPDGKPQGTLSSHTDVTEKKRLEGIALRAQRMDSIGALAGGIAHDLNNALAPVVMSTDLLRVTDDPDSRQRFLDIISSSAQRATGMVKQILGFARGTGNKVGPLVVAELVREMAKIVRETFPKSISVEVDLPEAKGNLWQVRGDSTEIHQVLLNLCVNARDAMEGTGRITLGARNVRLDGATASDLSVEPGAFVMLAVTDTGTGIPPEVLPRIFEPFFSTKTPETGTGLGLSTVAGIVRHCRGVIDVKTEAGKGTEFRIYLPAIDARPEAQTPTSETELPMGNGELILVIDDEEAVRELARATLENYGYKVVTAQNGVQGVACFEEHKNEIRLVVCDTDMPVMDGASAIRAIKQIRPDIPVVIASGTKRETAMWERIDPAQMTSLPKPFGLEQLLIAVALAIQS